MRSGTKVKETLQKIAFPPPWHTVEASPSFFAPRNFSRTATA
jgi:hypothetical protein